MPAVSRSSMTMRPPVGSIIRLILRREVVLPHPDGPTSTVILPVGAVRLSASTATVPSGYCLVTDSNRIIGSSPHSCDGSGTAFARSFEPPRRRLRRRHDFGPGQDDRRV